MFLGTLVIKTSTTVQEKLSHPTGEPSDLTIYEDIHKSAGVLPQGGRKLFGQAIQCVCSSISLFMVLIFYYYVSTPFS